MDPVFFFVIFFLKNDLNYGYLHVCAGVPGGQKKVLNPIELEL